MKWDEQERLAYELYAAYARLLRLLSFLVQLRRCTSCTVQHQIHHKRVSWDCFVTRSILSLSAVTANGIIRDAHIHIRRLRHEQHDKESRLCCSSVVSSWTGEELSLLDCIFLLLAAGTRQVKTFTL